MSENKLFFTRDFAGCGSGGTGVPAGKPLRHWLDAAGHGGWGAGGGSDTGPAQPDQRLAGNLRGREEMSRLTNSKFLAGLITGLVIGLAVGFFTAHFWTLLFIGVAVAVIVIAFRRPRGRGRRRRGAHA